MYDLPKLINLSMNKCKCVNYIKNIPKLKKIILVDCNKFVNEIF
jgi:hypothetical protein